MAPPKNRTPKAEMAQMGASSVQRTRWNGLDAIVKTSPSAVELAFYQHTAPLLRAAGIHIPELLIAEPDRLVIEWIPHPVALDEFHSCDIGLAQIVKLHRTDVPSPTPLKPHGWSQEQTDQTLALLSLPERCSEPLRQTVPYAPSPLRSLILAANHFRRYQQRQLGQTHQWRLGAV
ncbi:hypothetical protein [Vibrio fluvialis]|uniref:hypothetical protein n=1 Tax=Vibrio fluvialis TaxID=676 RepID=UPI001EEBFF60|nr:hypothetical protein [Vibrio fluvialis]MCG6370124.1 hypothetical protein [Vibrio fluvialis]